MRSQSWSTRTWMALVAMDLDTHRYCSCVWLDDSGYWKSPTVDDSARLTLIQLQIYPWAVLAHQLNPRIGVNISTVPAPFILMSVQVTYFFFLAAVTFFHWAPASVMTSVTLCPAGNFFLGGTEQASKNNLVLTIYILAIDMFRHVHSQPSKLRCKFMHESAYLSATAVLGPWWTVNSQFIEPVERSLHDKRLILFNGILRTNVPITVWAMRISTERVTIIPNIQVNPPSILYHWYIGSPATKLRFSLKQHTLAVMVQLLVHGDDLGPAGWVVQRKLEKIG